VNVRERAVGLLNDVAHEIQWLVEQQGGAPFDVDLLRGLMEQDAWAMYRVIDPAIRQDLCIRIAARALVVGAVVGEEARHESAPYNEERPPQQAEACAPSGTGGAG